MWTDWADQAADEMMARVNGSEELLEALRHDLAAALRSEYERGKQHGADDRKMIEQQNRMQDREIYRLKGEIAKLKRDIYAK